ncbi:MAG TPA: preprotein translocase subunit SecG [Candidatus Binataceae bacterium]|nr:preprotein translocase subunit SecG [Candidatus Binataceae bacterium]
MVTAIVAVHIVICFALVIVVLLQQGKGADVGAVFGGSSSTVFGASGAGNFMTKLTWGFAIVFFSTSILLAIASTHRVTGSIFEGHVPAPLPVSKGAPPLPSSTLPSATHPVAPAPVPAAPK